MDLRLRLFLLAIIAAVLATSAFQVTKQLQPDGPSRESIGLEWLRQEYQLSDEAHERIIRLHQEYFSRCDAMCAEMIAVHRPSTLRHRSRLPATSPEERMRREKAICERCLNSMISHLRQVSAIMEPEQGRRFLSDILPEVTHPPELRTLKAELRSGVQ
jgi:hypothetical protein